MKGAASGKTLKIKPSTDWDKLRSLTNADIRKSIEVDPDVHPTDEKFWRNSRLVLPRR